MAKQGRGELTDRIKKQSKKLLGYEIDVKELRFMAYFHYTMVNTQKVDPVHMDAEEILILDKWLKADRISTEGPKLICTKEFWDALGEIIYLGYVDLSEE